jgi:hypothetical protein
MPSTHQDNGVSMGGTLKRLSTLKKLKHFGGLKRPGKLVQERLAYEKVWKYSLSHQKRDRGDSKYSGVAA